MIRRTRRIRQARPCSRPTASLLFAVDGGLVLEVAEERECGVESVALLQLTVRDAKHLRRELDRVLRHRPRAQSGPLVLIPAAEYRAWSPASARLHPYRIRLPPPRWKRARWRASAMSSRKLASVAVRDLKNAGLCGEDGAVVLQHGRQAEQGARARRSYGGNWVMAE